MCLLAVLFRVRPDTPLVVAANRDEWLSRPAGGMQRLREHPRVLGGLDQAAGGTWLAVNEHGLVAGLTNKPSLGGRDPAKRSRGELPLALAAHDSARAAVERFGAEVRTGDYNPCWLLAGDREALFHVDLTTPEQPEVLELVPGIHVLENRPLAAASAKARQVADRLAAAPTWDDDTLVAELQALLSSHTIPEHEGERSDAWRPLETEAACVHAGAYGTRSSSIILVSTGGELPRVLHAPGPPCRTAYVDATAPWR